MSRGDEGVDVFAIGDLFDEDDNDFDMGDPMSEGVAPSQVNDSGTVAIGQSVGVAVVGTNTPGVDLGTGAADLASPLRQAAQNAFGTTPAAPAAPPAQTTPAAPASSSATSKTTMILIAAGVILSAGTIVVLLLKKPKRKSNPRRRRRGRR